MVKRRPRPGGFIDTGGMEHTRDSSKPAEESMAQHSVLREFPRTRILGCFSDFGGRRGEIPRGAGGFKTLAAVGAIAKGFVFGVAATAQADDGTSAKPEGIAVYVGDNEVAFDPNGTVGGDRNFRWHLYLNPNNKFRSILTVTHAEAACLCAARL
jgi:hypothetical protein